MQDAQDFVMCRSALVLRNMRPLSGESVAKGINISSAPFFYCIRRGL